MKTKLLLSLLLLISGLLSAQEDGFSIQLKLDDLPKKSLIKVAYLIPNSKERIEVKPNEDSTFYTGKLDEVSSIFITITDEVKKEVDNIQLFIGNEDVVVEGSLHDYTVMGSKTQDEYEVWRKMIWDIKMKKRSVFFDTYRRYKSGDTESQMFKEQTELVIACDRKICDSALRFIHDYPDYAVSVMLLNSHKEIHPPDTVRYLFDRLTSDCIDSEHGKSLMRYLEINADIEPLQVGEKCVDFKAFDVDGETISFLELDSVKDKYILLVFSGPGCPPCERSIPELKKCYQLY